MQEAQRRLEKHYIVRVDTTKYLFAVASVIRVQAETVGVSVKRQYMRKWNTNGISADEA